jgi:hypothetical protein
VLARSLDDAAHGRLLAREALPTDGNSAISHAGSLSQTTLTGAANRPAHHLRARDSRQVAATPSVNRDADW